MSSFTALDLYEKTSRIRLSTGCCQLDELLGGGLPFLPITEITGEAGVGKSQFLLKLALTAQLPLEEGGLGGASSVILSTEGRVPVQRMRDYLRSCPMLQRLKNQPNSLNSSSSQSTSKEEEEEEEEEEEDNGDDAEVERIFRKVFIDDQVTDADSLWTTLKDRLPLLLAKSPGIRLVIVDSITSVFRGQFLHNDSSFSVMAQRNEWFFGMSGFMKQLHFTYGCMFVLANQVTTDLSRGSIKPALGLAWSHCVNQRLVLAFMREHHHHASSSSSSASRRTRRSLTVDFSPTLPCGVVTEQLEVGSFGLRCGERTLVI